MRTEDFVEPGEQILWEGEMSARAALYEAAFGRRLPLAALWLILTCLVLFTNDLPHGLIGIMLSGGLFFFALFLLPVWLYLGGILKAKLKAGMIYYRVTNRGVYIRDGEADSERFIFKSYDEITAVSDEQNKHELRYGVGTVKLELAQPHVKPNGIVVHELVLEKIPDYKRIAVLIRSYQEQYLPINETAEETAAVPAAEQNPVQEPVPEPLYAIRTDIKPEQLAQGEAAADPQADFFGSMAPGSTFLEPQVPEADLPDESLTALQKELFAGESVRTQVFPDPTVNPLPPLPEMQSPSACGMQDRAGTSSGPYALPPELAGRWGLQEEPEMKPLELPDDGPEQPSDTAGGFMLRG